MTTTTALKGEVGTQIFINSNVYDAYGQQAISPINWTSSNPIVATVQRVVDKVGGAVITCFTTGVAFITASSASTSENFTLTVVSTISGPANSINITTDHSK